MKLYKLTNEHDETYGHTKWGEGVTHETSGKGKLCGSGWLHAYTDPRLAVLLNPIHGGFAPATMHLWECEGEVGKSDFGLKVGCTRITTIRRIPVPQISTEDRVRWAICAARKVFRSPEWDGWAIKWLSEEDRTAATARATADEAYAANAAACAAANAAAYAADYAEAYAAGAAADAAARATAEAAAEAAADAAAYAARAAADAAARATADEAYAANAAACAADYAEAYAAGAAARAAAHAAAEAAAEAAADAAAYAARSEADAAAHAQGILSQSLQEVFG